KALLFQKQTKKYCISHAAVITIFTILFFDYRALAGSYKQDSKMPKCQNNLGEAVVFINGNSDRQKPAAGMAKRNEKGQPIVVRFNYENAPIELQQFINFHECAHHQVGDIDRPHPPRNSYEHLMNESIADCIAILRFRDDEESTYESYENLITSLEKDMKQLGFPAISISSRTSNISNCYENYGSAESFIAGVIKKRGLE
ncbi:hypothetical protein N9X05_18570, partial [Paracoccaceae bacterium]|nr:hypothetical protein [Paracoccaceae bacterium]